MTDEDRYDKSMADEGRCDKSMADEDCCGKSMADEDRCDKSLADKNRCDKSMACRCCAFIFAFIIASAVTCGIIALILFLTKPTHIDIQQLYIREDSSNTTSIVIDLKFKNPLYTDDLNVALYCSSCQSYSAIGYCIVPGFNHFLGTAHREAVVALSGPSWDYAQRKLAQGSTVELRVEITTNFISSVNCRDCTSIEESGKCYCSGCGAATPVKVVAGFLLEGSGEVSRIS